MSYQRIIVCFRARNDKVHSKGLTAVRLVISGRANPSPRDSVEGIATPVGLHVAVDSDGHERAASVDIDLVVVASGGRPRVQDLATARWADRTGWAGVAADTTAGERPDAVRASP